MSSNGPALTRFQPTLVRQAALDAWSLGNPQLTFEQLAAPLADLLAALASPVDQAAAALLALACVARHTTNTAVGLGLARRLTAAAAGGLAGMLDSGPAGAWLEMQRFRPLPATPADLPVALSAADPHLLRSLNTSLALAWQDLPQHFWHSAGMAALSGRPPAQPSGITVLVPPGEADPTHPGTRPSGAPVPAAVMAATPPGAAVVDAWAERLWLHEAVEAVLATQPREVRLEMSRPAIAGDLAQRLLAVRPELALAEAGTTVDPDSPFPLPEAWPLACYRRDNVAADIVIPVVDRDPRVLADDLTRVLAWCPDGRVRLGSGLTSAQAAGLLAALPRPTPVDWSLALCEPSLPASAEVLRSAGLDQVLIEVGPGKVAAEWLAVVVEALRGPQIGVVVTAEIEGLGQSALAHLARDVLSANPDAVSWLGQPAREAADWWRQVQAAE